MSGAGVKTFTNSTLTAAEMNTYLMQQSVMTFASAAARTTAFSAASITPSAGMTSFRTDAKVLEIYNGSAWVIVDNLTLNYTPTFWVSRSSIFSTPVGGTIIFDSVKENVGSHYSTTTGLFTAPIDGVYEFHGQTISNVSPSSWKFLKNGTQIKGPTPYHSVAAGSYVPLSASVSTFLSTGQTMGIYFNAGNWYGDGGDVHNSFSGALIAYR